MKKLGVDILSTTLSGYTKETLSDSDEPDFELLEKISEKHKFASDFRGANLGAGSG